MNINGGEIRSRRATGKARLIRGGILIPENLIRVRSGFSRAGRIVLPVPTSAGLIPSVFHARNGKIIRFVRGWGEPTAAGRGLLGSGGGLKVRQRGKTAGWLVFGDTGVIHLKCVSYCRCYRHGTFRFRSKFIDLTFDGGKDRSVRMNFLTLCCNRYILIFHGPAR